MSSTENCQTGLVSGSRDLERARGKTTGFVLFCRFKQGVFAVALDRLGYSDPVMYFWIFDPLPRVWGTWEANPCHTSNNNRKNIVQGIGTPKEDAYSSP